MTASYAHRHNDSQAQWHLCPPLACKPFGMADKESLPVQRLRLFLAQYEAEHGYGWQTRLAGLTGRHQTHLGRLSRGERGPGLEDVSVIIDDLGVSERFFYDRDLGDAPDYRDFVKASRVDRDDAKGTQNAEAYIASQLAIGKPVSEEHARRLRSINMSGGDMPIGSFELAHRSWLAEEAGRALPPRPGPVGKIDEARGQRKIEPTKKRR